MVKYKKTNGFPFDVNDIIKKKSVSLLLKEEEDVYIRQVIMVVTKRVLVQYEGDFKSTSMQSKQYVHGLFDGFNLAKEQSL